MEENALYTLASGEEESSTNYGFLLVCTIFGAFVGYVATESIKGTVLGAIGATGLCLIGNELTKGREPV